MFCDYYKKNAPGPILWILPTWSVKIAYGEFCPSSEAFLDPFSSSFKWNIKTNLNTIGSLPIDNGMKQGHVLALSVCYLLWHMLGQMRQQLHEGIHIRFHLDSNVFNLDDMLYINFPNSSLLNITKSKMLLAVRKFPNVSLWSLGGVGTYAFQLIWKEW